MINCSRFTDCPELQKKNKIIHEHLGTIYSILQAIGPVTVPTANLHGYPFRFIDCMPFIITEHGSNSVISCQRGLTTDDPTADPISCYVDISSPTGRQLELLRRDADTAHTESPLAIMEYIISVINTFRANCPTSRTLHLQLHKRTKYTDYAIRILTSTTNITIKCLNDTLLEINL